MSDSVLFRATRDSGRLGVLGRLATRATRRLGQPWSWQDGRMGGAPGGLEAGVVRVTAERYGQGRRWKEAIVALNCDAAPRGVSRRENDANTRSDGEERFRFIQNHKSACSRPFFYIAFVSAHRPRRRADPGRRRAPGPPRPSRHRGPRAITARRSRPGSPDAGSDALTRMI